MITKENANRRGNGRKAMEGQSITMEWQ
jgi:hypothetical protein